MDENSILDPGQTSGGSSAESSPPTAPPPLPPSPVSGGPQRKKSSSFQITKVQYPRRGSNDCGEDSNDDVDDSHTEDTSDITDSAADHPESLVVYQSDIANPGADVNAMAGAGDSLANRFTVVGSGESEGSAQTYKRGRWLVEDSYLDEQMGRDLKAVYIPTNVDPRQIPTSENVVEMVFSPLRIFNNNGAENTLDMQMVRPDKEISPMQNTTGQVGNFYQGQSDISRQSVSSVVTTHPQNLAEQYQTFNGQPMVNTMNGNEIANHCQPRELGSQQVQMNQELPFQSPGGPMTLQRQASKGMSESHSANDPTKLQGYPQITSPQMQNFMPSGITNYSNIPTSSNMQDPATAVSSFASQTQTQFDQQNQGSNGQIDTASRDAVTAPVSQDYTQPQVQGQHFPFIQETHHPGLKPNVLATINEVSAGQQQTVHNIGGNTQVAGSGEQAFNTYQASQGSTQTYIDRNVNPPYTHIPSDNFTSNAGMSSSQNQHLQTGMQNVTGFQTSVADSQGYVRQNSQQSSNGIRSSDSMSQGYGSQSLVSQSSSQAPISHPTANSSYQPLAHQQNFAAPPYSSIQQYSHPIMDTNFVQSHSQFYNPSPVHQSNAPLPSGQLGHAPCLQPQRQNYDSGNTVSIGTVNQGLQQIQISSQHRDETSKADGNMSGLPVVPIAQSFNPGLVQTQQTSVPTYHGSNPPVNQVQQQLSSVHVSVNSENFVQGSSQPMSPTKINCYGGSSSVPGSNVAPQQQQLQHASAPADTLSSVSSQNLVSHGYPASQTGQVHASLVVQQVHSQQPPAVLNRSECIENNDSSFQLNQLSGASATGFATNQTSGMVQTNNNIVAKERINQDCGPVAHGTLSSSTILGMQTNPGNQQQPGYQQVQQQHSQQHPPQPQQHPPQPQQHPPQPQQHPQQHAAQSSLQQQGQSQAQLPLQSIPQQQQFQQSGQHQSIQHGLQQMYQQQLLQQNQQIHDSQNMTGQTVVGNSNYPPGISSVQLPLQSHPQTFQQNQQPISHVQNNTQSGLETLSSQNATQQQLPTYQQGPRTMTQNVPSSMYQKEQGYSNVSTQAQSQVFLPGQQVVPPVQNYQQTGSSSQYKQNPGQTQSTAALSPQPQLNPPIFSSSQGISQPSQTMQGHHYNQPIQNQIPSSSQIHMFSGQTYQNAYTNSGQASQPHCQPVGQQITQMQSQQHTQSLQQAAQPNSNQMPLVQQHVNQQVQQQMNDMQPIQPGFQQQSKPSIPQGHNQSHQPSLGSHDQSLLTRQNTIPQNIHQYQPQSVNHQQQQQSQCGNQQQMGGFQSQGAGHPQSQQMNQLPSHLQSHSSNQQNQSQQKQTQQNQPQQNQPQPNHQQAQQPRMSALSNQLEGQNVQPFLQAALQIQGQVLSLDFLDSAVGGNSVAIDNRIVQALDIVKDRLIHAVREEVDELKVKIDELNLRIKELENENFMLRGAVAPDLLAQIDSQKNSGTNQN